MNASLRKRVDRATVSVAEQWRSAWDQWAVDVVQAWMTVDPDAQAKHDTLFQPLYAEWGAAYLAGELPTFLSRGAVLAKWWPEAPLLWEWFWEVMAAQAKANLSVWPSHLPEPPLTPDYTPKQLAADSLTAESCVLIIAACLNRARKAGSCSQTKTTFVDEF